jgi:hypothetical protein
MLGMARSRKEILETDDLYRRVFKNQLDKKNFRRVLPGAFMRGRPPEVEKKCSVNVDRLMEEQTEPMIGALPGQRLAKLSAAVPMKELNLDVDHAPEEGVPSHAHILDIPDEEACSKLASKSVGFSKEETMAFLPATP